MNYAEWLKKYNLKESPDYNLKDAYIMGVTPDKRGHLPDTFKLPNHITYSDESMYSKRPGAPPAGSWAQGKDGKWAFFASPTNLENAGGPQGLMEYFKNQEPDATLILPPQPSLVDILLRKNLSSGFR